jgi:hypothetical protein
MSKNISYPHCGPIYACDCKKETAEGFRFKPEMFEKKECEHEVSISDSRNESGTLYRCVKCNVNLKSIGWEPA